MSSHMIHPGGPLVRELETLRSPRALKSVLRVSSVLTMLMTLPQAVAVWVGPKVSGVSLVSWLAYLLSACLWLVYGVRKRDRTIYLPCIGWILLDAAVVIGVVVHG